MTNCGHPSRDKVVLFLGDAALIAVVALPGWYLPAGVASHSAHKLLSLCVVLLAFLAAMYVFDLYSLAKLNGLGTMVKVAVAVGAASGFCNVFFHLFQWKNPAYYRSLLLCMVVFPAAAYIWRRCYFYGARRLRAPENLLVVGRARDAETLQEAMGQVDPQFSLLGILWTEAAQSEAENGFRGTTALLATREEARGPQNAAESELRRPAPRWAAAGVAAYGAHAVRTAVAMAGEPLEAPFEAQGQQGKLASAVAVAEAAPDESPETIADLGPATSENLLRVVGACSVNVVVVRSDALTPELAGVLTRLRFSGIQVYSLLDFCMRMSEELPLEVLDEFWLCIADGFELLQARFFRRVKRLMDVLLASVGLLVALPFLALAGIAIRLNSPGPVLFRQRRVGWMGRPFDLLKLRSMQTGAEKDGRPQWATQNDPRVTAVGRILRKTHFDELPQMINILRGEMSFVGPRPERPEFVGLLNEAIGFYHLRHYVLPGITGWAQVNYPYGASLEDARRKLQYDLYYVCNASPLLDLRTLLRTARVVLFRQGSR